jgi:hypothetical protein
MVCSIANLGSCIVEALFGFIIDLINLALQPFLTLIHKFLTEPVSIVIFGEIWSIIVYVLSMFYGLLLLFVGFKFILSGESPEQRESAKLSLRNTIIMIVLVQASYHLYSLIIEIGAGLSRAVLNLVSSDFFLVSLENYSNFGFEIVLSCIYLSHLIIVLLILLLRYICVSAGAMFFAIGIFFYFISFLNQYGRLILNILFVMIFLPFFYSLIFLITSKLLEIELFVNYKSLLMIGSLNLIMASTILLLLFVIIKASTMLSGPVAKVAKIVKYIS